MKASSLTVALAAALLAAGCSNTEVISKGPDTITISADSQGDLPEASGAATDYCKQAQKRAELQRTETTGKGVVAYYACK